MKLNSRFRAWARLAGSVILAASAITAASRPGDTGLPGAWERGLPAFFLPSHIPDSVQSRYWLRSPGLSAYFGPSESMFRVGSQRLTLRFLDAPPNPRIEPLEPLPGRVNFLVGNQPDSWKTDLPTYGAVAYRELYAGIDLVYSASGGTLKSEYRLSPGADPSVIRWQYQGVGKPRLEKDGSLVAALAAGQLREEQPLLYQEQEGRRTPVKGGFRILKDGSVGFWTGPYDRKRGLVIDPVLSYSTYLGGSGLDTVRAMAVDSAGNVFVAGYTDSSDFPVAGSPLQSTNRGGVEAFVAKLNPAGSALVYCTYLGGSSDDRAFGIAVDSSGIAYLTGWTYSSNFPTTSGVRQRTFGGGRDGFVSKLNSTGSALVYSTYLGGGGQDSGNGIAIDASGNAFIAGDTYSTNFPALNGYRSTSGGRQDAFVSKLNPTATSLVWSTYLGGTGDEGASALTVDSSGGVYVTGGTTSTNFPTNLALQGSNAGGQDAFVTKLAADGKTLPFSTYLGGSGGRSGANEMGTAIQRDAAGAIYVAGLTSSINFPTINAFQPTYRGGTLDGFVSKLDATGSALLYSTYLGGNGNDYIYGLAVAGSRAAAVVGYTSSSNFPLVDAIQTTKSGPYEGFIARLRPSGNALEIGTFLGGSDSDAIYSIATDRAGNLWVAGQTLSLNFPLKNAIQSFNAGGYSAFVTKIADNVPVAAYRSTDGSVRLLSYADNVVRNAGGYLASDAGTGQLRSGDTYVVARNSANQGWLNLYQNDTQSWRGWVYAGSPLYGNLAVVGTADGGAYVVARDSANAYWLARYLPASGFQGWVALGRTFASDPSAAAAADGTLYVAGTDSAGVVWVGRYLEGSGFLGWVSGGSPGSVLAAGKPAITVGSDHAAYVATRASDNTLWAARVGGGSWGAWSSGASNLQTDPSVAAGAGVIYVLVNSTTAPLAVRPFVEGTGGGWQGPIYTTAYLASGTIAASHGRYFIIGRDWSGALWWYESGADAWTYYGSASTVAGELTTAPR
jgi:hypothetical protein